MARGKQISGPRIQQPNSEQDFQQERMATSRIFTENQHGRRVTEPEPQIDCHQEDFALQFLVKPKSSIQQGRHFGLQQMINDVINNA